MKIYNKYIGAIMLMVAAATFSACNKKLDVTPGKDIVPDQIKTADDVQGVLMGAYTNLQDRSSLGERLLLIPDLLAGNGELTFRGTFFNYGQYDTKTQDATSDIAEEIWQRGFTTVNNINLVISKIDLVPEDQRPAVLAEAKFIRGVVYYYLVNLYGKPYSAGNTTSNLAVPLILDAITDITDLPKGYQGRATVDAVYKQVVADLQDAAANLPEDNGSEGRANKYAAYAFLSRVYLAEAKYTEAVAMADSIIQSGAYSLNNAFDKAFNSVINTSEDIFAIQQTAQSNAGNANAGLQTFYGGRGYSGRGDITVNLSVVPGFESDDARRNFTYLDRGINVGSGTYTTKWQRQYKVIPVVRYAEIILTRAEANLRAGTAVGAPPLDDVNEIRARSNASQLATVTADQVADERVRELLYEGDKLWTYKRLKRSIGSRSYDDNKLVLPIPQREIDASQGKLNGQQNPGY